MASYGKQTFEEEEEESMLSNEEIKSMMMLKAHDLFAVCDKEDKGFINKRDMQRLQTELPLSSDQLEAVFDSLDDDGNGFLTREEFTEGFGSFIGLPPTAGIEKQESVNSTGSEHIYENDAAAIDSAEEEESFNDLVQTIGAHGVFEELDVLRSLWSRVRREEPELLSGFEEFLGKVSHDLKQSHSDLTSLESALRNKSLTHDEEVRRMYEEMENQLRMERERIIAEEKAKERHLKEEMERELLEKENQLREMMRQQTEMEEKLETLVTTETETKQENDQLIKEKEDLERMLTEAQRNLDESTSYIHSLRSKTKDEKKQRAMAALQIGEGIALERESLVKQLDMLRDMNKKLRDDRDEHEMRRAAGTLSPSLGGEIQEGALLSPVDEEDGPNLPSSAELSPQPSTELSRQASTASNRRNNLIKQGSILSNYFGSGRSFQSDLDEDIEVDDFSVDYKDIPSDVHSHSEYKHEQSDSLDMYNLQHQSDRDGSQGYLTSEADEGQDITPNYPRGQPLGGNEQTVVKEVEMDVSKMTPERVFKVVFVGDSGVGKSTFIHRFCTNEFKGSFSATIGVDFQVKNLLVDEHLVALQLWDTAGQERFRSITKQYFRKADGVLIMYDVTSESSFTNVRNWMSSVQDGVEENTVLLLVGNKTDLCEDDEHFRVVKEKDGAKLADEYGALFYETSAKSGYQVPESVTAMASLLREKEDNIIANALNLTDETKKKGCCS